MTVREVDGKALFDTLADKLLEKKTYAVSPGEMREI